MKRFLAVNFGCRVNSAEINQLSQFYLDSGYTPDKNHPDLILINTCAVTKKGEYESLFQIKKLSSQFPQAKIIVTGCANLNKVKDLPKITILDNSAKNKFSSLYSPSIKDKFSHTHRYLLKIQSGCTQFCSYCLVPFRRKSLWSLPINTAINTVNQTIKNGYQEVIITGVNIDQYQYGLPNLTNNLLINTKISLISFGSIPLNCINTQFTKLLKVYPDRLSRFLHIPIQSGSDQILTSMHRPYSKKDILKKFNLLKKINGLTFGTDIIVGYPGETEKDFQETYNLCQSIGFSKIHVFKFSPRPGTTARELFLNSPKINKEILKSRSLKIRSLISQTTLPSHQIPET